jgi:hypothetical protein
MAARRRRVADERSHAFEHGNRLLQVDDVDAVARAENVGLHLGIPPARLMAEVDPRF